MSFIFVSHAAPDKQTRVRPLVHALAIEGVSLWIDRPGSGPNDFQLPPEFVSKHQIQSLRLGQDWDDGIKSALRDAGAVLVCLSKAALEPDREVLQQEMWGAQLTLKAVTCIIDDLDLSTVPGERGLLSLGKSQSLRIDTETLELAIDWLSKDAARTPDQLPKVYQFAWQGVRQLRDELHRRRDEAKMASPSRLASSRLTSSGGYRWPTPWDFSAYMADKREIFEGRDWLFGEIANWQAASHSRAMLIRADFGIGKSAVIAELVHRNPGGSIAAWHFCQHDTQETLQPGAFVRSLAAQFAATVAGYKDLIDADSALQERLDRALTDPGSALEGAVLAPLAGLPAPPAPRLLVVDALDEALELDAASPRNTGTIISLLAAKVGRFPPWLRVLATSRPNPQVLTSLNAFGTQEIDAESVGNQDDLRRYILGRCAREPLAGVLRGEGHAAESLAALLVERSLGKFLYAVRAMRDLENGRIGVPELVALPPGMDSFYLEAFDRRFVRVGRDYEGARQVLGILAVAREPLPAATVATVLCLREAEVKAVHKALPDFLRRRAGKLTFDHFSMAEWLTRDNDDGFASAGDYAVDIGASQAALRAWALREVEQGAAHRSGYLLRHLPAHLGSDDERRRVCGALLLERFEWLQARLSQAGVEALFADAQTLQGLPGQQLLLALLRNSAHVLRPFPEQLAAQVLGRLGDGQVSQQSLAALSRSAMRWLAEAEPVRQHALLRPVSRSLRLSTAHQATLIGGSAAIAVLPDGRIASASADNTVLLWDPAHPAEPFVFEGHSDFGANVLAVLPDGRIASGSRDKTVRLWDPANPAEPLVFEGHSRWVIALAVLPDGRIASASADKTVRLWDPAHLAEPLIFEGHSDEVTALAVLPDGRIASASADKTVRLWDPTSPAESLVFEGHSRRVDALAVLPDGRIASGSGDKTVCLWDPAHPAEPLIFEGHSESVIALAVLPDGRIASGSWDKTVRLWDRAHPAEPLIFEGHSGRVDALAVLPDGRIASGSADKTVRLWDPAHPAEPLIFEGHSGGVTALAVLPGGRIASAADYTLRLWDPAYTAEPLIFEGHSDEVTALAVRSDGRIASGSADETVRLWDPAHPAEPLVFEGHSHHVHALAELPDGRIASGSYDKTVRLWDPEHPAEPLIFEGHAGWVDALAVLPDGRIASGSRDKTVRLWDPEHPAEPLIFEGHSGGVTVLAVLPDGRIASGSADVFFSDHTVRLWDPVRPAEPLVFEGHSGRVHALAALPDGRIASASADKTVRLWDPTSPAEPLIFEGHSRRVTALAVLPDGRIASGSGDKTVRLWDPEHPAEPLIFEGHFGSVTALAVLPDGRIASASADNTVRLWDPTGKRAPRLFVADAAITCIAAPTAGPIVAGCADGAVHFLREID